MEFSEPSNGEKKRIFWEHYMRKRTFPKKKKVVRPSYSPKKRFEQLCGERRILHFTVIRELEQRGLIDPIGFKILDPKTNRLKTVSSGAFYEFVLKNFFGAKAIQPKKKPEKKLEKKIELGLFVLQPKSGKLVKVREETVEPVVVLGRKLFAAIVERVERVVVFDSMENRRLLYSIKDLGYLIPEGLGRRNKTFAIIDYTTIGASHTRSAGENTTNKLYQSLILMLKKYLQRRKNL